MEMECGERDRVMKRESGSERADALRRMNLAMQKGQHDPQTVQHFPEGCGLFF